jgi:hypothetical protein
MISNFVHPVPWISVTLHPSIVIRAENYLDCLECSFSSNSMPAKLLYPLFFFLPKVVPRRAMLIMAAKPLSEELQLWS